MLINAVSLKQDKDSEVRMTLVRIESMDPDIISRDSWRKVAESMEEVLSLCLLLFLIRIASYLLLSVLLLFCS